MGCKTRYQKITKGGKLLMLSNKSTVQFNGTEAQEKELLEMIRELKDEKGAL